MDFMASSLQTWVLSNASAESVLQKPALRQLCGAGVPPASLIHDRLRSRNDRTTSLPKTDGEPKNLRTQIGTILRALCRQKGVKFPEGPFPNAISFGRGRVIPLHYSAISDPGYACVATIPRSLDTP